MSDAEKILDLMKARGLSQNAFAKETGVAQSYISYIINGKSPITEKIAKKICIALDIDDSYFKTEPLETKEIVVQEETKQEIEINASELTSEDMKTYEDIIEIAIGITKLRTQLLDKIKADREKDKYYNGIDQDFLHNIENLDKLSDKEAVEIVLKEKESRKNRRIIKNRIFVLQNMLNTMPQPNLYQYTLVGIEKTKNYEYRPRIELSDNDAAIKGNM